MTNQHPLFCPECGKPNPPTSKFCSNCGCDLNLIKDYDSKSSQSETLPPEHEKVSTGSEPREKTGGPEKEDDQPSVSDEDTGVDKADDAPESEQVEELKASEKEAAKPPKSSKGKIFLFLFIFIAALGALGYKYRTVLEEYLVSFMSQFEAKQRVTINFTSNVPDFTIYTSLKEKIHSKTYTYSYSVSADTVSKLGFLFEKNNFKSPDNYVIDLSKLDLNTEGETIINHEINFQMKPTEVKFRVIFDHLIKDAFININGSTFLLGNRKEATFGPFKVSSKTKYTFSVGSKSDLLNKIFKFTYPSSKFVDPGKGQLVIPLDVKTHYAVPIQFNFVVKDEFSKPVANAEVDLGYNDVKGKTNADGHLDLIVKDVPYKLSITPQVRTTDMFPLDEIETSVITPEKTKFSYNIILKLQDVIYFKVVDQNDLPVSGATIKSNDKVIVQSTDEKGEGYAISDQRGKTVDFTASRIGFQADSKTIRILPGKTTVPPFRIRSNQIRIAILDQFTEKPIPDVRIKFEDGRTIQTTRETFQILTNIQLNESYSVDLKHISGNYLALKTTIKPTIVGEILKIYMEPKPRLITIHFMDEGGRNLSGVKAKMHTDHGIINKTTGKEGQVSFKVYTDSVYSVRFESDVATGDRLISTDNMWSINSQITLRKSGKVIVTASPGNPKIIIRDPDTKAMISEGLGSIEEELKFGGYQIETDCGGFLNIQSITLNSYEDTIKINCEHPWIVGKRLLAEDDWLGAENSFEQVAQKDRFYCEAQFELFEIHRNLKKSPDPTKTRENANNILRQKCQILRRPFEALLLGEYFVNEKDYENAQRALKNAEKYRENVSEERREEISERIEYFLILNDHQQALAEESRERCAKLNTVYSRWLTFTTIVNDPKLKERVQTYMKEADNALLGC